MPRRRLRLPPELLVPTVLSPEEDAALARKVAEQQAFIAAGGRPGMRHSPPEPYRGVRRAPPNPEDKAY